MKQSNVKAGTKVKVKKSHIEHDGVFIDHVGIIVGLCRNGTYVLVDFNHRKIGKTKLHRGNGVLERCVEKPTTNTCWYFHSSRLKLVKE